MVLYKWILEGFKRAYEHIRAVLTPRSMERVWMTGIRKSLLLWSAICLVGFGVFEFWHTSVGTMNVTLLLLAIAGIAGVMRFGQGTVSKTAAWVFVGLFLLGLLVSWLWEAGTVPIPHIAAPFAALWFALFAVGFVWAGYRFKEQGWYLAGIVQLVVLVGLFANIGEVVSHAFGLLAITSGVPLLLIGYKH